MRFLDYLFFKYYYFQVRVGNEDIAPFSAIAFMSFVFAFIYADIIGFYCFFISDSLANPFNRYSVFYAFTISFIVLVFMFYPKKRYKRVLKDHEYEWKRNNNIGAVLFAVIPFLLFFVELFIPLK